MCCNRIGWWKHVRAEGESAPSHASGAQQACLWAIGYSDRRPSGPVERAVLRGGNVGQPHNLANPILVCLQQRTNNDREGWHIRLNVDREQVFCLTFMFSITMVTSVVLQCSWIINYITISYSTFTSFYYYNGYIPFKY